MIPLSKSCPSLPSPPLFLSIFTSLTPFLPPSLRYLAQEAALRVFLTTGPSLEALDPGTTCALLAGYGRMEELVAFAGARGDNEAVLEYLMQVWNCRKCGGTCGVPAPLPPFSAQHVPILVSLHTFTFRTPLVRERPWP